MGKLQLYPKKNRHANSWREYQHQLKRSKHAFGLRRVIIILFPVALYLAYATLGSPSATPKDKRISSNQAAAANQPSVMISKQEIRLLLADLSPQKIIAEQIQVPMSTQRLKIDTSLNLDLQTYLLKKMDRKNSRFIGIVVMEANTGRILALAGFNKNAPDDNPCLKSSFPAASIFKIVTAAAAVDLCGLKADTVMHYNGYQHTLYKSQLKEQYNQYTNHISFKNSFAKSINPVFGKLGVQKLGKSVLEEYAIAFGFNQPIDFEFPVSTSSIQIEPEKYHWAEIASGFNNDTTLSPVHAAMMASAVVNGGRMVDPTIVDRVTDENGHMIYQSHPTWPRRAMTTQASKVLAELMETTIRSGTGRKPFRDQRRNRVLSKLEIGGKTGSIFNRAHDARFDWFVGYANEKQGSGQLAIAALVAHEDYIGIRATQYARMAIDYYYKGLLAQDRPPKKETGS